MVLKRLKAVTGAETGAVNGKSGTKCKLKGTPFVTEVSSFLDYYYIVQSAHSLLATELAVCS
jgi:hypothetical protein